MPDVATAPAVRWMRSCDLAGDGMAHEDLERPAPGARAADAHVAATVDREPIGILQRHGGEIGGQALAGAAAVELHTGRPPDDPELVVHGHAAPASRRIRCGRGPGGGLEQGRGEADLRTTPAAVVPGRAQGGQERRVHQPARAFGGPQRGADRAPQERRGRHDVLRRAVERAQLAALVEAGEAALECDQEVAGRRRVRALGDDPRGRAHGREADVVRGHELRVVSGGGAAGGARGSRGSRRRCGGRGRRDGGRAGRRRARAPEPRRRRAGRRPGRAGARRRV